MLAIQTNLLALLEGKKQFIIPIYQRTYSWTEKQCRQLWDDIIRAASDDSIPAHFIGSVVYIKASPYAPLAEIPEMLVIDGQQRLTTLTLLLLALREAISKQGEAADLDPNQITEYLINKYGKSDRRHKLVLTQRDKGTLAALLEDAPLPADHSYRIHANFRFFQTWIQSSGMSAESIYRGIHKLILVDISLDRAHDNPQLIFESLNSTGLDLSQADLIRNFVLMGQTSEHQNYLYVNYWYPIEQQFGQEGNSSLFDRFIRDYLTVKLGRIPKINEVYIEFKRYFHSKPDQDIEEVVKDVSKYASYFINLAFSREKNKQLCSAFFDINFMRVDVASPFLMEIYNDYAEDRLSAVDFLRVLRLVESYVFRRSICAVPTNSLNNTFAALYREIEPEHYIESLEAAFMRKESYKRFPRDDEFHIQLLWKDIYNFGNRNYFLAKLENAGHKELVELSDYTIEHIMPQSINYSDSWKTDLGDDWQRVHETYLHTIGNLTLTGYNSEYSNHSFIQKRDHVDNNGNAIGFKNSTIRLNEGLGNLNTWNEAEIMKRAESIAHRALKIWPCPSLSKEVLAKYTVEAAAHSVPTYNYDKYAEILFGDWLDLFDSLRTWILDLDDLISESYIKNYMTFQWGNSWLISVTPQRSRIQVHMGCSYADLHDPFGMALDAESKYKADWAPGTSIAFVKTEAELDSLKDIIRQVLEKRLDASPSDTVG